MCYHGTQQHPIETKLNQTLGPATSLFYCMVTRAFIEKILLEKLN